MFMCVDVCFEQLAGADKSLDGPRMKPANISVKKAWISFGALPCRKKKKKTYWQLASRFGWNRARPWHVSELISFLVGLRTYRHPGIQDVCILILDLAFPSIWYLHQSSTVSRVQHMIIAMLLHMSLIADATTLLWLSVKVSLTRPYVRLWLIVISATRSELSLHIDSYFHVVFTFQDHFW